MVTFRKRAGRPWFLMARTDAVSLFHIFWRNSKCSLSRHKNHCPSSNSFPSAEVTFHCLLNDCTPHGIFDQGCAAFSTAPLYGIRNTIILPTPDWVGASSRDHLKAMIYLESKKRVSANCLPKAQPLWQLEGILWLRRKYTRVDDSDDELLTVKDKESLWNFGDWGSAI